MSYEILEIGGNCPVHAEGVVDGYAFYFRARGSRWTLDVLCGVSGPWEYAEDWPGSKYAAGWMSEEDARKMIGKACDLFSNRQARSNPDSPLATNVKQG